MKRCRRGRRNKVGDAHQPEWKPGKNRRRRRKEGKGEWRKESRETGRKDSPNESDGRGGWSKLFSPDSRHVREAPPKTLSEWAPHPRQGAQPTSLWFQVSTAATCPPSPSKTRTYSYIIIIIILRAPNPHRP